MVRAALSAYANTRLPNDNNNNNAKLIVSADIPHEIFSWYIHENSAITTSL